MKTIEIYGYEFTLLWLRVNCSCCISNETKERIICYSDFPINIDCKNIEITEKKINIVWNDDHITNYNTQNLIAIAIISDFLKLKTFHKNNYIVLDLPINPEILISLLEFCGLKIINSHFGRFEDLKIENKTNKNIDQLGYTKHEIDLHTDLPFYNYPPQYQVLQCVEQASEGGGETQIVDVGVCIHDYAFENPKYFKLLTTQKVCFSRKQTNFQTSLCAPIITMNNGKLECIRHSYFSVNMPLNCEFEMAYIHFTKWLKNKQKVITLKPGQAIIYNNHTTLHGRQKFNGKRWFRGFYFDNLFSNEKIKSTL